ncbi:lactate racemase domain-containing protein [uncultured Oscillibacter sp.]|uniref:lactate racemase domain-containing protein n=1 Tax=uncultured Oscillibacter sp. TaxID=876091 RepID=UPI0026289C94|nr:lactate racemase domain-containing protein [uncultured Oscillibacter sp.]
MEIKEQSGLRAVLENTPLPKVCRVRQIFQRDGIQDVPAFLREKLDRQDLKERIKPGMRVVLTGSSRQIHNMPEILRELASFVRAQGGEPWIIPAMGSHGGATDEGQRQILESYGITEEFCGCPIFSSMETVRVGELPNGDEVRVDKFAHEADAVIVVGRIKAHTAFRGPYESGLIKMMAIGMGKRAGADSLHREGFGKMGERLPEYARVVFDSCNIIFGVAPIENEFDETCRVEVIPAEEIFDREPELLLYAKSRLPRILIPETDILMVREIGKNFSGSGMDPNVTGTFGTPYATGGIRKQRTVVLDISPESHGSYIGLGKADVSTKRVFEKLDTNATYFNMITSTVLNVGKIPMILEDDKLALQTAVKTLTQVDRDHIRLVYIKNTLSLENIIVSEALAEEIRGREDMEVLEEPRPLRFDERGTLLDFLD